MGTNSSKGWRAERIFPGAGAGKILDIFEK